MASTFLSYFAWKKRCDLSYLVLPCKIFGTELNYCYKWKPTQNRRKNKEKKSCPPVVVILYDFGVMGILIIKLTVQPVAVWNAVCNGRLLFQYKRILKMSVLTVEIFKEWKSIFAKGYIEIPSCWQFLILSYSNSCAHWKLSKVIKIDRKYS